MRSSDWMSDVCSSDLLFKNTLDSGHLGLKRHPLRLWKPLLAQPQPCLISTALPCRAMPFGDAGIGAADRFAHGDHWPACAWLRTPVQAQGGCRIKEAIGKRADMQCPRETAQHGAQTWTVGDRQSVVEGKSVSVSVDLGGRSSIKKKKIIK